MSKRTIFGLIAVLFVLVLLGAFYLTSSGVPILAYHSVRNTADTYSIPEAEFENQLRYLAANGYTVISLNEMLEGFAGKAVLPERPVVLTFDDGYRDNYTTAFPILQKYKMKATVFIITGSVGEAGYLRWEQLKAMQQQGIEIGSHTLNHLPLRELDFTAKVSEVTESKKILDKNLDIKVSFLAYPFGSYDRYMPEIMKQAGYLGACTGKSGTNYANTKYYNLYRINIPNSRYGLLEFKTRLWRGIICGKLKSIFRF